MPPQYNPQEEEEDDWAMDDDIMMLGSTPKVAHCTLPSLHSVLLLVPILTNISLTCWRCGCRSMSCHINETWAAFFACMSVVKKVCLWWRAPH